MGSKPSSAAKHQEEGRDSAKSGRNGNGNGDGAVSDEDLKKYTGMTREQLREWSGGARPGVGPNRGAGDITAGPVSGLGGTAAAFGYGGWGPGAGSQGKLKFPIPPEKREGKKEFGSNQE